MNRRERLEQIRKSRGWHPAPDGVGCMACSLVNALAEAEKVIEAARESWRAIQDIERSLRNPDMGGRHYGNARDKAEAINPVLRAALSAYDTFMEGSET